MDLYASLRKMRLLLIEDDEWIRDSLSLFFTSEGCHLMDLETGEEGIRELENQTYDIIIIDYRLPDMDGLEFSKLIHLSHPQAMKIIISAYGTTDVVSEAQETGIHDCIEKPFTAGIIEESLLGLIEQRQAF